ncbi:MAG: DUF366 family protein, partial [Deltaproteobacteria bacterium]|nr:DUF366 family protein [Deltaproteobacteria bacterium]
GCKIYSEEMLHFIVEKFGGDLDHMILHQRIFVSLIADALRSYLPDLIIKREGNDLFDGHAKLNISIATASPVSCLMHIGINISSHNTPVKTKGLNDYKINPKTFAEKVLKSYKKEVESIAVARSKAKPVT